MFIIYKTIDRKKHYLSVTGKWIKSTPGASVMSRLKAEARAKELGARIRSAPSSRL